MGTHPIFESDFDCLTDMNTNNLNRTTSISKVFKDQQKTFAKNSRKTAEKSTADNSMQVDGYNEFQKDLEELPILIDLNSSTESASSASTCSSSNSSNTSSSFSNTTQPYQFYFGEISSQEVIETDLEIVLPELEEISNSTLPDFTLYQDNQ